MMIRELTKEHSILSEYVAEIRDASIQSDRMRFRTNMNRIGSLIGYELSKTLEFEEKSVTTPLGTARAYTVKTQPIIATILRAGLAMHDGLSEVFDKADHAFISAFRKHDEKGDFTIRLGYVTCPPLDGRTLIVSDPMLATGSSIVLTLQELYKLGTPARTDIVTAIASEPGIQHVQEHLPNVRIWAAAVDSELDERSYIVPGLGDAGDLAFGEKMQN